MLLYVLTLSQSLAMSQQLSHTWYSGFLYFTQIFQLKFRMSVSFGITELLRLEKTLEDCLVQYFCRSWGRLLRALCSCVLSPSSLHNLSVTAFQHTLSKTVFLIFRWNFSHFKYIHIATFFHWILLTPEAVYSLVSGTQIDKPSVFQAK